VNDDAGSVGFYGKLPGCGDFVRRRVTDAFVEPWDRWLQRGLEASRRSLGEEWLDVYLTSPVWRFACAAGVCGSRAALGVLAPSVDHVGRYFPMTIVATLPCDASPLGAAASSETFFTRAERLVVDTLAADDADIGRFDAGVLHLERVVAELRTSQGQRPGPGALAVLSGQSGSAWRIALPPSQPLAEGFAPLLWRHLDSAYEPAVLLWTEGSARVPPTCLLQRGLPCPSTFAALLDGSFTPAWQPVPAESAPVEREDAAWPGPEALTVRSAGATHVGCLRELNEDAFLEHAQGGVWVVADGLGGHRDGQVASRMVCDALAGVTARPALDDGIEAVRARLAAVNAGLLAITDQRADASACCSTVVALLACGDRAAVMWAGDSRAYRWRRGVLERLTRDHAPPGAEDGRECHAVTRAVGGEPDLELDVREALLQPGDRVLLCSDGLTRVVSDADLRRGMAQERLDGAVHALIHAALSAGAPDNVTVVIAEAFSPSSC
jgi:type VI secretion system protein ImpM